MDEADRERTQRCSHLVRVVLILVGMSVQVEVAVPPTDEEANGEKPITGLETLASQFAMLRAATAVSAH